jgi:hypothetical protein
MASTRKVSKANQARKAAGKKPIGKGAKRDSRKTIEKNQARKAVKRPNTAKKPTGKSGRSATSGGRAVAINLGTGSELYISRVKRSTAEFFGLSEATIPDDFRGRGSKGAGSFKVEMDSGETYSFPQHPETKLTDVRRFVKTLNPRPTGFISKDGVYHSIGK